MLSCSIWYSAPSFWIGGGLESRCVGRVYGADGAVPRLPCGWCRAVCTVRMVPCRVYRADGAVPCVRCGWCRAVCQVLMVLPRPIIISISYNHHSAEHPNSDSLTSSHYSQYSNRLFRTLHPSEGRGS